MTQHGPWKINTSTEIYRDPWLDLRLDHVTRPDGLPGTYSTVRLKPGICVVALDQAANVYLTREFHYAVGRVTLEGVSGGVEASEEAEEAAKRELEEELGIQAVHWRKMGMVDPFTASVSSPTQLFAAGGLRFGKTNVEGTELIDLVKLPLHEAIELVHIGEITHAPTCVLLLKLALLAAKETDLHAALGFT